MMQGEVVQAYGNPVKLTQPLGEVKLLKKLGEWKGFEEWMVVYVNNPEVSYNMMFKKENDGEREKKID